MNDVLADIKPDGASAVAATILERDWWRQELLRHQAEAARWQRRVELAERHQEYELATQAAQRARHHAGLALAAIGHRAECSIDARLAAINATQQATMGAGGE